MTDGRLDSVLASVGIAFDAAVAREEEDAAADLAISLLQDRDLADVVGRGGSWTILLPDGGEAPLTLVGADFLAAATTLIPVRGAVVTRRAAGQRPETTSVTFVQVLRGWARGRVAATVCAGERAWSGTVTVCGRDYVGVRVRDEEVFVSLDSLAWARVEESGGAR